ncbi:hypothetical protein N5938_16080 [Pseudomonas aeruginosa]|uniref:hypothetical protein n=1 Tax=Pseudomonas aeruginosa TaxID=287 RepID=UPI0021F18DE1|nr:hypothetical protein [Pseudomonas aeruginosa]UYM64320.1 hypothetical protein N5938_16080 [Pseudomonas aeruginosa]
MQLALTHGPIDAVHRFIYGEREAWSGNVTDNAQIFVNAPELLGGDKREGGVSGYVDLMFGETAGEEPLSPAVDQRSTPGVSRDRDGCFPGFPVVIWQPLLQVPLVGNLAVHERVEQGYTLVSPESQDR